MSEEKQSIGGIEFSGNKDSELHTGNITTNIQAGGDIVCGDKITNIQFIHPGASESEKAIEERREQELALQDYFDRMTKLILECGLGKLKPGHATEAYLDSLKELFFREELSQAKEASLRNELWSGLDNNVSIIAYTLTLMTLRRLNGERKRVLLNFLYDTELILVKENRLGPPLNLRGADLTRTDLNRASLSEVYLSGANLSKAVLTEADLSSANLRFANLSDTELREAYLQKADITFAKLSGACLNEAKLYGVNLQSSDLSGANLHNADLRDADLRGANLLNTILLGAKLEGTMYDDDTIWPEDFTPPPETVKLDKPAPLIVRDT